MIATNEASGASQAAITLPIIISQFAQLGVESAIACTGDKFINLFFS